MSAFKKQTAAFGFLLLLIISPLTEISAQKTILTSQILEASDFTADLSSPIAARIATAKAVYHAGETVVVNGSGFGKGEAVTINVVRGGALRKTSDLMAVMTATADGAGNISAEWYMPFDGEFVITATGSESGVQTETIIVASVTPVVINGNPSCATVNGSNNPAFAHITSNWGFKLDKPSSGVYPFTNGNGRELTGGAPSSAGNSISFTRDSEAQFDWSSTRSITAVIVKSATKANVYPYNPAALGDLNLKTATNQEISHVEFCFQPPPTKASLTIIKDAQPNTPQSFGFKASGQVNDDFSLVDNGVIGPDRIQYSNLTGFGAGNTITITEDASSPYSLIQINCTSNLSGVENNVINVQSRFAKIQLEAGENVVCTFINAITTAANVSVAGIVTDASGNPIARARLTIQNLSTGEIQTALTSGFGYYRFENLSAGDTHMVFVAHKRYAFAESSQVFSLIDALENVNFIADPE